MTSLNFLKDRSLYSKSIVLSLGNMFEFYDISIYGLLATTISPLYFPIVNNINAYIVSFGVFSVAYIARPFGAFVFGYIADVFGRKRALTLSLLIMSLATGMIGILPTYEQIGIFAPLALVFLRFIQGVSAGGEFPNSCIFLLEQSTSHQGLLSSLIVSSGVVGIIFGSIVCHLASLLNIENNWRIPFLIGILIGVVSYMVRKHLAEVIPIHKNLPLGLRTNFNSAIVTFFITAFANITFYMIFFYFDCLISMVTKYSLSSSKTLYLLIFIIVALCSGLLSDMVGAKKIMQISSFLFSLIIFPIIYFLSVSSVGLIYFYKFILTTLSALFMAVQHKYLIDLWPIEIRCRAISILFSIGGSILGGTTPMFLLLITKLTGYYYVGSFYIIIISIISFLSITFLTPGKTAVNHKLTV